MIGLVGGKQASSSAHWGDENSILWGFALENIWNIFMEEQIGKVRVMFSKRSWSAPELEDNMGQSHFSALESHVVTQQDSSLSSVRESTLGGWDLCSPG